MHIPLPELEAVVLREGTLKIAGNLKLCSESGVFVAVLQLGFGLK
jgi:hypothetical protein